MKQQCLPAIILLLFIVQLSLLGQKGGEEIFNTTCKACHTISHGRLVGPDLSGVYKIRDNKWMISFIRSSQKFIKSGDTAALALYNKFNHIPMPDNPLSDQEILGVIDFIKQTDQKASATTGQAPAIKDSAGIQYSAEFVPAGSALFNGYNRFARGASPCLSCHNLNDQTIMGGGKLSLDLTGAYKKLGPAGINAILTNPPFPVMNKALLGHPLTQNEIRAVISLLKSVNERAVNEQVSGAGGFIFFILSFVTALFLLIHIYLLYDRRKISSKNYG